MLKTMSPTGSSIISQLLINTSNKNELGGGKSGSNKTNLKNLSTSKKFIKAGYLTSEGAKKSVNNFKKGAGNTQKGIKAAKGSDNLTLNAKKNFNHL